ncbi:unnamed protein product, partial [Brugia pahangi]|uniref:Cytochrome P450 n=1 Tax=Brugia pahangi TaxID=6280 RepID=A0A0N4T5M6_BRUPA
MGLVSASLITLVLVWIIHFVIKKLRTILKQINAVQGPPTWPLIGNLHQFHFKPDVRKLVKVIEALEISPVREEIRYEIEEGENVLIEKKANNRGHK